MNVLPFPAGGDIVAPQLKHAGEPKSEVIIDDDGHLGALGKSSRHREHADRFTRYIGQGDRRAVGQLRKCWVKGGIAEQISQCSRCFCTCSRISGESVPSR